MPRSRCLRLRHPTNAACGCSARRRSSAPALTDVAWPRCTPAREGAGVPARATVAPCKDGTSRCRHSPSVSFRTLPPALRAVRARLRRTLARAPRAGRGRSLSAKLAEARTNSRARHVANVCGQSSAAAMIAAASAAHARTSAGASASTAIAPATRSSSRPAHSAAVGASACASVPSASSAR